MKQGARIMIGCAILAPLMLVVVAERDAKLTYTAAYIDVPFADGSLTVELLPDSVSVQRSLHLKIKGVAFNRFPVSSPLVPQIQKSFNPHPVRTREWEWGTIKASVAIVSLILLITFIVLFKEREVSKSSDR